MRQLRTWFFVCSIFFLGGFWGLYNGVLTVSRIESLYLQCAGYSGRQRIVCLQSSFSPYVRSPEVIQGLMRIIETTNMNRQDSAMPLSLGCHDVGHVIGEVVSRTDISLGILVNACGRSCEFGCVHGVITGRVRAKPSLLDQVNELCAARAGQTLTHIQQIACHHGVGHVFAELSGYRVGDALNRCTRLLAKDARSDCASGVFMEIFRPPTLSHTPISLPEDVIDYCNKIPNEYRFKCIYDGAMVTYTLHKSLAKGMRVCAQLPDYEKSQCEKAVGGAVYAEVQADPLRIVSTCQEVSDQALPCILGAIIQPLVIDPSGKLSLEICAVAGERFRATCEQEVQNVKASFNAK